MPRKHTGNPVGRPPRGPYSKKNAAITTRIGQELRDRLQHAAKETGYSLSQEIEQRLEESFRDRRFDPNEYGYAEVLALCRLLGMIMRHYRISEGEELWSNAASHQELKDAVLTILEALGPEGGIPRPSHEETPGQRRARSRLTELVRNKTFVRRSRSERITTNEAGKDVEVPLTIEEIAMPEIWEGLGDLAKKLEATE